MAQDNEDVYKIKRITFLDRRDVPIFCQSINGPCPLLAIANVLSLRGQLTVSAGASEMSASHLMSTVAERILDSNSGPSTAEADLRFAIQDCLEALSKMGEPGSTGLDVNLRFDSTVGFEATREVAVFDLLGISLLHGWLVDPQDHVTAQALGSKTYNQAVELIISGLDSAHPSFSASRPLGSATLSFASRASEPPPTAPPAPHPAHANDTEVDLLGMEVPMPAVVAPAAAPAATATALADDVLDDLFSIVGSSAPSAADAGVVDAQPEPVTQPSQDLGARPWTEVGAEVAAGGLDDLVSGAQGAAAAAAGAVGGAPPPPEASEVDLLMFDGLNLSGTATTSAGGAAPSPASPPPAAAAVAPSVLSPHPSVGAGPGGNRVGRPPVHEALAVREFLECNASQLTVYGISQIASTLNENALAIFFRNNHFNCLFKHGRSLYLLITDQGYLGVKEVVWERLDTVDGDTQLCGPDFLPHKARRQTPVPSQINMEALAAIPPEALAGLSEADAAAIAEAAGVLLPAPHPGVSAVGGGQDQEQHGSYQPPPLSWQDDPEAAHRDAQRQQQQQQQQLHQQLQQQQQQYQQQQQQPYQQQQGGAAGHNTMDADLALAMQLQEEEEEEARRAEAQDRARAAQQAQGARGTGQPVTGVPVQGGYQQQGYPQTGQQQQQGGQQQGGQQQYYGSGGAQSVRPAARPVQKEEKKEESSCNIM